MYKFTVRPGYESQKLLIEFSIRYEDDEFLSKFLKAIDPLNPKVEKIEDLWMNDEVMIGFESEVGDFLVSKDVWGLVFVISQNNDETIEKISEALDGDPNFSKKEKESQPGSPYNSSQSLRD